MLFNDTTTGDGCNVGCDVDDVKSKNINGGPFKVMNQNIPDYPWVMMMIKMKCEYLGR